MNVGKCQSVAAVYGVATGRVRANASSSTGLSSGGSSGSAVQEASATPAVLDKVDRAVHSAVEEFLYLSGDDRLESYSNLDEKGKRKFMKAVGKLVKSGEVDESKLDLGERSEAKESFLDDYAAYSSDKSASYSSDGRSTY